MDIEKQSCLRDFDVLGKLGEGAFGQVFKVKRKADGKQYALKKVKIGSMKEKQRQNALNQIRILASYDGDYIIGYKEAFYDDVSATLCIVMEFASSGDLLKKVNVHMKARTKFKQQEIWRALVHMTKGLKSLHDKKILHRDLKCANVFITGDGVYKLGDLNVSKVLKKDLAQTQTGTPYYASPEVWKDKPYGKKSDMWSLGCVLYEMAALSPPFKAQDLQGLYRKVCAGVFERIPLIYSNQLSTVINSLLKVDPDRRPSTEQILNNPVVQKKYNGEMIDEATQSNDELLKTIKYNPRDLKGLKNILPKSNYEEEPPSSARKPEKGGMENIREEIKSCKVSRKQSAPEAVNDQKLRQFLERRRLIQDKQRQKQLKLLKDQREQISKKRERVLSACGVRQPYVVQSPRIAVHNKKDTSFEKNPSKKVEQKYGNHLPPKVPRPPPSNQMNYKLPPRPASKQQSNQAPYKNVSYDYNSKRYVNDSRQKQRSIDRLNTDRDREKSKQNLKRVGERAVQSRGIGRSNSVQRVVYPSWWG